LLSQLYVWFSGKGRLSDLAKGLGMLNFDSPGGVFDNVRWNQGKIEARAPNRTAAANLCSYLLNLDIESPEVLRERLAKVTKNDSYKLPKRILRFDVIKLAQAIHHGCCVISWGRLHSLREVCQG
jgi:hypothetical protein